MMYFIIKNAKGSTILEYSLICALIALIALATIGSTGLAVSSQFRSSALALNANNGIPAFSGSNPPEENGRDGITTSNK